MRTQGLFRNESSVVESIMQKKKWLVGGLMLVLGVCAALAQDSGQFVGAWKGTWEGGGAGGRFEITVEKGGDGKLNGGVSVGQDDGDYVAKFTAAVVEGGELKARYSYTPDAQADIVLTGKLQDGGLSGTWMMVAKGGGADAQFAAGTWTVKK
jgi:hypothetical protein